MLEGVISGIVLRQAELRNISLMQPTLTCCPRPTMAMNASVRVCACACVSVCECVPSTRSVFKHGTLPLAAHLPQHTPAPVSPKCRQRLKWRRFAASSCSLSLLLLSAAAAQRHPQRRHRCHHHHQHCWLRAY